MNIPAIIFTGTFSILPGDGKLCRFGRQHNSAYLEAVFVELFY